ncbi:MAG: radical SAM protein [Candidatus Omnitrophica bacterium]|nr:radical SAM protein [Candidatus Omnitrophota bacterium]
MKAEVTTARRRSFLRYANTALKARIFNRKTPLLVSWVITRRCNFSCPYCQSQGNEKEELTREQALDFVDRLARVGTQGVTLTGGEPLMRADLGQIVDRCVARGITVGVNSNGAMVEARIQDIRNASMVMLSLDGPENIHDAVRGPGSFAMVMRAVDLVRSRGIKVSIAATLSSVNLSSLDAIFKIAREQELRVYFQPAEKDQLRHDELNPITPSVEEYRRAISAIMLEKTQNAYIGNSVSGLKYLYSWPDPHLPLKCYGGLLFVRVEANGDVKICGRHLGAAVMGNILKRDIMEIMKDAPPVVCTTCWSAARLEFNKAMAFDLESVLTILKKVK